MPARPDFATLARASGIANVFRFDRIRDWAGVARDVLAVRGTTVVVLEIEPVPMRAAPRSPGPAAARAIALRAALRP
jgi:hypothetical protein